MSVFRFATVAIAMSLAIPFGSTPAATSNPPPPPPNHLVSSQTLDLRAVGSQLVVDTIEDALRQGGLALFEEGFQFESSLNWIFGESIEGEVDVVVPLWSEGGQALFVQPGAVFWTGLAEEERIDGNFGAVYRTELFDSFIGGGSVFYDYDFQYGHSRLGAGVDLQSGLFQAGFNYYHPLDEWDEGRTDYEEQALRGVDFRVALEREVMRLGANLSYWRFEGEEDEKGDWKPSYGFDAGIRIVPGVFLEGGWEGHDETVSLDQRWNAGLAFRFSLPDFKGASYGEGGLSSNLWKFVEREKRILYEERLGIPRVNLTDAMYEDEEDERAGGVAEGNTVTIPADIGKPLDEDVMLHIMIAETSTAVLGTDFTYAHRVYELNEATGAQSAPEGDATPCAEALCEVMIPAGVTRFDIEADILADNDAQEVPKSIDFQVEVPEEYAGLVRGSFVEQVTLRGHGNEVQFASAASTLNEDPDTPEGRVAVSVNVDLPSPVSITLNVGATDDAASAMIGRDYSISTRSLTIPANASSASLTLEGINNDVGEGSKTIELTLSGDLPDGWAFGSQTTHTVTLQDDDLSVFVAPATPRTMEEPADGAGASTRMITVGITQQPPSDVSVTLSAMGATRGTAASGGDFTFADTTVMFARTASELTVTRNITIADDSTPEGDETIILTLTDPTGSLDGTGFSLAGPYTITIPANDNTVGFASNAVATLNEDGTANVEVSVNQVAPVPITLNVATSGTADEGTDYENLPDSVTIGARQSSGTITLTGIDDDDGEGPENIDLELTVVGSLPSGWTLGDSEHRVTIQDNDSVVGFATDSATVNETDSNTTYTVNVEISNQPSSDVMLDIGYLARSTAMNTTDASFSPTTVTFSSSDFAPKPITITIVGDTTKETETETFILLLKDDNNTRNNGNNAFMWGHQEFTLNINPSDNVISINSSMSDSTVREDATSPAELVVSVDEPSPTPITLNVSATSPNGAGNGDYTVPSTLVIPANMSTGTLEITAIDDETEEAANLEINLSLSGSNLPTGWGLVDSAGDPATSLTHTVTILDDESAVVGWDGNTSVTHTAPSTGSNTVTLTVRMSKPPSSQIDLVTTFTGTATLGLSQDFFSLGGRRGTGCEHISFSANAMGNDLVQTCNLTILPAAAGKNIIATLSANTPSQLTADGFSVSPTVLTVTVNSP